MILYVNGDSHSVGAELVFNYKGVLAEFDEDIKQYQKLSNRCHDHDVHVECIKRSYGQLLADHLGAKLVCDAESGGSNSRIIRVTREYLKENHPDFLVIGWSPIEREEWWHNGTVYQISGGGVNSVPVALANKYKQWVIDQSDPRAINLKTLATHQEIFDFHKELLTSSIPHIFFNTFNSFQFIPDMGGTYFNWGDHFVEPYSESYTYCMWLKNQNYQPVSPNSMHFGPKGHRAWANFLHQNYFKK